MRPLPLKLLPIATLFLFLAEPALAQKGDSKPPAKPQIDPEAMIALEKMGAYLRTLKTFQIDVATTEEDVLADGQKLQYAGTTTIVAQLPHRLRASVSNDLFERLFFFDGKTFTLVAERAGLFATIPAPPTVGQLADQLERDFGFGLPLVDLFRWGSIQWSAKGSLGGTAVGPSSIAGTRCEHYAFREKEFDWQIWLQKGDHPVPRKLVITAKTDEARPQYSAVYTWNLSPSANDRSFVFEPPAGMEKVSLPPFPAGATETVTAVTTAVVGSMVKTLPPARAPAPAAAPAKPTK